MKVLKRSDLESMEDDRYRARLINCLSGVKTAVLIGTADKDKNENVAVFSSLFHLGANPALMGLIFRPHVTARHTLENIHETGQFTINIMPASLSDKVHQTSARFPKSPSEFEGAKLKPQWIEGIECPFVEESVLKWHMSFVRQIDIPENGTHMIIGAVENIFIPENILKDDGFVDLEVLDPCLVSGLDCYHQVKNKTRYAYAKPEQSPVVIL